MEFKNYTIEDFVCDESFNNYVFHSNKAHFEFWEEWISNNPYRKNEVEKATQIILQLYPRKKEVIPEDHLLDVSANIHKMISKKNRGYHVDKAENIKTFWTSFKSNGRKYAASLSILCLVSIGIMFYISQKGNQNTEKKEIVSTEERTVPRGQKLTLNLSDGSVVKLNSESSIRFPHNFSRTERIVYLEGEAFFDIARDTNRPFIIQTGNVKTTVLGTSFNINSYNLNNVQVAVNSGKVKVENMDIPTQQEFLNAKELLIVRDGDFTRSTINEEKENKYFGWKEGVLYFNKSSLAELKDKIERWYDVKVIVENEEFMPGNFTGQYKNKNLYVVMEGISFSSNFTFNLKNKQLIITGKP